MMVEDGALTLTRPGRYVRVRLASSVSPSSSSSSASSSESNKEGATEKKQRGLEMEDHLTVVVEKDVRMRVHMKRLLRCSAHDVAINHTTTNNNRG